MYRRFSRSSTTPGWRLSQQLWSLRYNATCNRALYTVYKFLQSRDNFCRLLNRFKTLLANISFLLLIKQATLESKMNARMNYEQFKIQSSPDGRGQDCVQYEQLGHTYLSCNLRRDQVHSTPAPEPGLCPNLFGLPGQARSPVRGHGERQQRQHRP